MSGGVSDAYEMRGTKLVRKKDARAYESAESRATRIAENEYLRRVQIIGEQMARVAVAGGLQDVVREKVKRGLADGADQKRVTAGQVGELAVEVAAEVVKIMSQQLDAAYGTGLLGAEEHREAQKAMSIVLSAFQSIPHAITEAELEEF